MHANELTALEHSSVIDVSALLTEKKITHFYFKTFETDYGKMSMIPK